MIESLSESTRTQDLAVYSAWLQAQQGLQGPQPAERNPAGPAPIQDKVEFSAAARVEAGAVEKAPAPNPPPGQRRAAGAANSTTPEDQVDLSPEAKKQAEEADNTQKSSGDEESKAGLSIVELKRLAAQGDYEAKMLLALYEAAGISVS